MIRKFRMRLIARPVAVLCLAALGLSLVFTGQAQASMCIVPPENGAWHNNDAATRGITRVTFDMECRDASKVTCNGDICSKTYAVEPHYFITMFGKCHPTDCAWGRVEGQQMTGAQSGWYRFYYDQGFARRDVWVRTYPQWPGWLRVWVRSDYTDGRPSSTMDDWFVR